MFYDQIEAEQFIAQRTGEVVANVRRFLETLFRYQEINGEGQPEDQNVVLKYISKRTNLSVRSIANMYAEDVAYHVTKGLMKADAYPYFRSWADAISEDDQEKDPEPID